MKLGIIYLIQNKQKSGIRVNEDSDNENIAQKMKMKYEIFEKN